jgi:hypothetical protein
MGKSVRGRFSVLFRSSGLDMDSGGYAFLSRRPLKPARREELLCYNEYAGKSAAGARDILFGRLESNQVSAVCPGGGTTLAWPDQLSI